MMPSWGVRFGAGILVVVQGAAVRKVCEPVRVVLASCRRCRVLLQGAAVRVACALWSWLAGAPAGCCFKVLLLEWHVRFGDGPLVLLQGHAAGCRAGCCFKALLLKWRVRFGVGIAAAGLL